MTDSLFGHLALRFGSSPENLATEALSFILNKSQVARESFTNLLAHLQVLLPPNLKFDTQNRSEDDPAIPDLVGKDANGRAVLLGEAKFWAGLTDNQPVTYLQRLAQSNGILLIFFAPSMRFPTLWPELQRRCNYAGIQLDTLQTEFSEIRIAKTQQGQFLILMTWKILLNSIHHSLITQGEMDMAGNIIQLQGLCEQMDNLAFLPLQSEELTSNISRRFLQYCDLVDEVTEKLVSERFASISGFKATGTRSGYIRYMKINKRSISIEFNADLWTKYRATPLWLGIRSETWKYDPEAKNKLVRLETEEPSRLFREGDALYVPLFLDIGVEKDEVVKNIIKQIKDVFELLNVES